MRLLTPGAVKYLTVAVACLLVVSGGTFAISPVRDERLGPANFDDTVTTGMTYIDVRQSEALGFEIPRAQVYFSQYRYVIGYYGVETAASQLASPSSRKQFGPPLAVYVTDYSTTSPLLTDEGYLTTERNREPAWVNADEAHYVVGSEARTPTSSIAVPFSEAADARAFADRYGGDVVRWSDVKARRTHSLDAAVDAYERSVTAHERWANETEREARRLLSRPVSTVVGRDAESVQAAIDAAPNDTTVRVPAGTYQLDSVTVDKPVTLDGDGAETVLRGDDNGTVVRVTHPRAAVSSLAIAGVGSVGSRKHPPGVDASDPDWDETIQLAYGYGDAGVVLDRANHSVVHDVAIDTPASGIIIRHSDGAAVLGTTVDGADTPEEGFMGTIAMNGRVLVEDSTYRGGRDGVYTHRAHGSVVRDNTMTGLRYGVHEMYTSETLLARNTVRDAETGLIIMTRPVGNLVVDNDVRESAFGVTPAGSASYFRGNVLAANGYGLDVGAARSIYVENTVVDNEVGARSSTIFPTNWVVRNDFVGNDRYVESGLGPLRTWSHDGAGNYWGELPLLDRNGDGTYDRAFQPSGVVDGRLATDDAAATLARSPAMTALRRLQDVIAGLRASGVVDDAPRTRPVDPDCLRRVRNETTERR